MARRVAVEPEFTLDDHSAVAQLKGAVRALRDRAQPIARKLDGRTIWMVNSTDRGGGVAEMLPAKITLLRDLGFAAEWLVLETDDHDFFSFTKRLHNLLHGVDSPEPDEAEREVYESVNRENAGIMLEHMSDGDIVIIHDPQPMPLGALLREHRDVTALWRCHIGLDEESPATRSAWQFLEPYAAAYHAAVFSAPEYVPDFLADRAHIIHPAIDPLTAKNMHIGLHHTIQILANSGLTLPPGPVMTPEWEHRAQRLQVDGSFAPATTPEDPGLLTRPIITQVSRWDRLKGFLPLMHGFAELKRRVAANGELRNSPHWPRLGYVRLVMAGPDPGSIQDDPESREVLDELCHEYLGLPDPAQRDIALITLPMQSARKNALMVNALHRVSTIVAQNSLREGFGLTITEAMWKRVPVFSNSRACGPRHQVRDGVDGRLIADPEDTAAIATTLIEMLCDPQALEEWARNAQHHVHDAFLIFSQLNGWLERLAEVD